MKDMLFNCIALVCLLTVQFLFAGCAGTSAPSKFYTLRALSDEEATESVPVPTQRLSVAIGPVEIPDYLDRPEIVLRRGPNELTLAQFDRWAGSLKDDITRVLSENLTLLLAGHGVSVFSWQWRASSDYRISLYIMRFDITTDGDVMVNALWNIVGKDGETILLAGESSFKEPIDAETYPARTAAMSKALKRLSRDIAAGLTSLL